MKIVEMIKLTGTGQSFGIKLINLLSLKRTVRIRRICLILFIRLAVKPKHSRQIFAAAN
jgi:hypothetical protein